MSDSTSTAKPRIRSDFAEDADFRELLEAFVAALPERRQSLAELFRAGSIEELGRQAHQLKGAGGGYGFADISSAAAELQHACRALNGARVEGCLSDLLDVLGRVEV
jgi:histidine phosphotransfer protein HptB